MKSIHGNISESSLKRKHELRDQIDVLRSRVRLLTGKDKLLMTMHFENGNSIRQLASLSGSNPATISRRIYKLSTRLTAGEYITCLRHRDRFSKNEMAISIFHYPLTHK